MTQPEGNPETMCPSTEDLRAGALGKLPEGWELLLLQHVEQCPTCRRQYDLFLCRAEDLRRAEP